VLFPVALPLGLDRRGRVSGHGRRFTGFQLQVPGFKFEVANVKFETWKRGV
jgi:hypothetical protein